MNTLFDSGEEFPLMEDFYSLQGEGYHTGKAAYFIRIGGCDIGCHWCDTKMSWDPKIHRSIPIHEIISKASSYPAKAVVVTGGEPSMYPLDKLCAGLHEKQIKTFVETSGAYPLSGQWDWICLSPKQQTPPTHDILPKANELKMIIFEEADFEWAETNAKLVNPNCKLYLQPEWSRQKQLTPIIVDYIKNNPKWSISLQTHKFIHIP